MSKKDYYEKNKDIISNKAKEHYINNRDVLLNRSKEYYINNRELIQERARNKYKSLTKDKKQKIKDYLKQYRENMTNEHQIKRISKKVT